MNVDNAQRTFAMLLKKNQVIRLKIVCDTL